MKRRIALRVSYNGSFFSGWQYQKNALSIQEVLEKALNKVCKETIRLYGCSRTDAGVHALAHISHFDTTCKIPVEKIPLALAPYLPFGVLCTGACEVSPDFHSRFSALGKRYSYTISLQANRREALSQAYVYHLPGSLQSCGKTELDIQAMLDCCTLLLGKKDFACFQAAGGQTKTTIRHLYDVHLTFTPVFTLPSTEALSTGGQTESFLEKVEEERKRLLQVGWQKEKAGVPALLSSSHLTQPFTNFQDTPAFLRVVVAGNGFLYNMVRIIVGTLIYVGQGKLSLRDVESLLQTGDRRLAGFTAPAQGLLLEEVYYKEALFERKEK